MNKTLQSEMIAGREIRTLKVVGREMPADLETPVSAFLKLRDRGAKILLESVESGTIVGRYSFICLQPDSRIIIDQQNVTIANAAGQQVIPHTNGKSPLTAVKDILQRMQLAMPPSHPRLLGGAVGYISYDLVRFFERIPDQLPDPQGLPLAVFYLVDTLLVFDHVQRRLRVMCLAEDGNESDADEKLDNIVAALRMPLRLPDPVDGSAGKNAVISNFTEAEFCNAVLQAKEHILAGDIFQLVLSQRLSGETAADPFMIYRALRMLNPSPYTFFLDFAELKMIGSSPEALVRLEDRVATVRPIAGTRPRSKDDEEDRRLGEELLADEKERAEHVMLVDLGRNDLGRCCNYGTVKVTDFMKMERYSHVMHLTSNVTGTLRDGLDQFDLFRATFPAWTVSGAPKIKAMSLIEKL